MEPTGEWLRHAYLPNDPYMSDCMRGPYISNGDPRMQVMQTTVLEAVRLRVRRYMSPALLQSLTVREIPAMSDASGAGIAYEFEGYLYGREARVREIEKRVERSRLPTSTRERVVDTAVSVPATWRDHLNSTVQAGITKWRWKSEERQKDRPGMFSNGLVALWGWAQAVAEKYLPITVREIPTRTRYIGNRTTEHVTRVITVEKHWHTCPHIDVPWGKSKGPHIHFLMDQGCL